MSNSQKILYALSAGIVLAFLIVGRDSITVWLHGDDAYRITVAELLNVESGLKINDKDIRIRGPDTFDKMVITGVDEYFRSDLSPSEVISRYSESLLLSGWIPDNSGKKRDLRIKFCKAGVSIIIEAKPRTAGANYYLGLGWTKYRHGATYCPPPITQHDGDYAQP